jgi:tRNA threonylcarbamoyladenosine biosynthesis protein TsaB
MAAAAAGHAHGTGSDAGTHLNAYNDPAMTSSDVSIRSLAIETSGRIGSVALGVDGHVRDARAFRTTYHHAVELLLTVDALCRDHGIVPGSLHELYVSGGPGSFTGLRVGITFARTLAWAGGVRTVRVPTLDAIAQNALDLASPPPHLVVILDAKRHRVFAARYSLRNDQYVRQTEPAEVDPAAVLSELPAGCAAVGEGVAYHADAVRQAQLRVLPEELNRARAETVHRLGYRLARRGQFDDAEQLLPIYLRRPEAEEVWERRHQAH